MHITFALRSGLKLILTIVTVEILIMAFYQAIGVDTSQLWAGITDALILGFASSVVIHHWVILPLEKAKQQNDLFHSLIGSVDAGVIVIDPNMDGHPILFANPSFCRITGYGQQDVLGRNPYQLLAGDDVDHDALKAIRQAVDEGKSTHVLQRNRRKDGSFFWNDLYLNPIVDEHQKILFWAVILHDVTEKRLLEIENRRLVQAVQQSDEAVCIFNDKGEIEFVNQAFYYNKGILEQDLKGREIWQFWEDQQLVDNEVKPTIEKGVPWSGRHRCCREDGSVYESLTSIVPVTGAGKQPDFYMALHRDVSEIVELENQFFQAQKMEAIGTLVSGMAHDFNNILAGMTGNLFLVMREIDDRARAMERMKVIESQCHRAADMIRQLLIFAREGKLDVAPFDIRSLINETIKFLGVGIPDNIQLKCEITAEALMVHGDPTQIQQALMNLANNARHAVEVGKIEDGYIRIRVRRCDDNPGVGNENEPGHQYVQIMVQDNGVGMDKETRKRIFEPFFTTKVAGKGTGLGLSMVAGCVEMHHGWIDVSSKEGEGTTINIFLPLLGEAVAAGKEQKEKPCNGNGELILIADDEECVRSVLRETLEEAGFRVIVAHNGRHAMRMFQLHINEWQLVILDVVMPEYGGLSAARRMSQMRPELPIAMMTGYNMTEFPQQQKGMRWHALPKPWNINSLNKVLKMIGKMERNES